MKGLVIKNTGSWYTVKTDDGQLIESKIKGNFRLKGIRSTNPVAVGDRVTLVTNQEGLYLGYRRPKELYHQKVAEPFEAKPYPRC